MLSTAGNTQDPVARFLLDSWLDSCWIPTEFPAGFSTGFPGRLPLDSPLDSRFPRRERHRERRLRAPTAPPGGGVAKAAGCWYYSSTRALIFLIRQYWKSIFWQTQVPPLCSGVTGPARRARGSRAPARDPGSRGQEAAVFGRWSQSAHSHRCIRHSLRDAEAFPFCKLLHMWMEIRFIN